MRMPSFALAAVLAIVGAPCGLSAQEPAPVPARPATPPTTLPQPLGGGQATDDAYSYDFHAHIVQGDTASRRVERRVRADLAALRDAQDAYFARRQRYAMTLDQLGFFAQSGAQVHLADASDRGWRAEVTHPALPGSFLRVQVRRTER